MSDLTQLLHTTFGFPAFRANQEAVCRAATDGRDVLLVMPTGAGKSLCYQLPALARQASGHSSAALIISPLIALMDDQAAKLSAAGLKVARIHSGLSRDDARQACRDYLDGNLNFLFIAPERMRVPGFPEMLARRKPALIAIDEAHCISAWGHDFRPDYRTLGDHLPALRPAPIIALTATATPTVQRDIVAQLQLATPALFIHGFRRSNLAIEVVEMSKPRRHEFTATLLKDKTSRPAIVYAPSRKACEELAAELNRKLKLIHDREGQDRAPFIAPLSHAMSGSEPQKSDRPDKSSPIAAAYHAGLEPSVRERVQADFQSGRLEVVVATIAFGMGIDKADVRTVVHTALPASVEAFYQEIGRAGRDGLPSRTVLLHSYADRKMHEFFLERDYPPATDLARVAQTLTPEFLMPEPLARSLKMDLGAFSKAIEKLAVQGIATTDLAGNVRASGNLKTPDSWRAGYDAQIAFRRSQIDRMVAFAEQPQCRMAALINHFGDTADGLRPCGNCDFCSPASTTAQTFAGPTTEDLRQLAAILRALEGQSRSTGKLHTEPASGALHNTAAGKDRKEFDALLDTLVRAALVSLTSDTFTNPEGNVITYRKAALTHEGREAATSGDLAAYGLMIKAGADHGSSGQTKSTSARPSKASLKAEREQITATYTPAQKDLELRLREWRKAEAAKTGKPAFIVFGDAVLSALVRAQPQTLGELQTVSGIGPEKSDRFGAEIIALCRENPAPPQARVPQVSILGPGFPENPKATPHVPQLSPLKPVSADKRVPQVPPLRLGFPESPKASPSRPQPFPAELTADLTPDQQALDLRLRAWRKSESEKIGLPQFFVLGASTLRSIVLQRPRTVAHLQTIPGIDTAKAEKFGAAICEVCNA